jgi:hypothetical protein
MISTRQYTLFLLGACCFLAIFNIGYIGGLLVGDREEGNKVTPLPPNIKRYSFFIQNPKETNKRTALAEMHLQRGHQRVYDIKNAHFIWSKWSPRNHFPRLQPWQRYNHMIGRELYGEKAAFAEGMGRYCSQKQHLKEKMHCSLPYLPYSFLLDKNDHVKAFLKLMEGEGAPPKAFVLKASDVNMGKGITMMGPDSQKLKDLRYTLENEGTTFNKYSGKGEYILQEYICNGLLFENQFKFDLRFHWFVASIDPLVVLFHDGFGRVSNVEYTESDFSNFDAHVTNISQNGRAVSWEDIATKIRRHFTHHEELAHRLGKDLDPVSHVLNQMKAILVDIINSFREASFGVGSLLSDNGFNILALDFYIDNDLDVFLIEPQSQPKLDYTDEARQAAARTVARKFQSDFLDVAMEVTKKQQILGHSILPLQNMGNFEVVYDTESQPNFHFSYEYPRPDRKKGCKI